MKSSICRIMMMCLVAMTIMVVQANAAVEVNNRTDISISVFIPCAARAAPGRLWTSAVPFTP